METENGIFFDIVDKKEIDRFTGYDRKVGECHIHNVGYIVIDQYGSPLDNQNDWQEIYPLIRNR